MRRQQQSVCPVHALVATDALRPGLDVAGAQEAQVGDAGEPALLLDQEQPALEQRLLDADLLNLLGDRRGEIDCRGDAVRNLVLERVEIILDRLEPEDDGLAQRTRGVGDAVVLVGADAAELAPEPVRLALAQALEHEQPAAVPQVFPDRAVAARVLHVAGLALAVVVEDVLPVLDLPVVPVAVLGAGLAGEEDDERRLARGGDATLLLPPQEPMDLLPAVVEGADFKGQVRGQLEPRHARQDSRRPGEGKPCRGALRHGRRRGIWGVGRAPAGAARPRGGVSCRPTLQEVPTMTTTPYRAWAAPKAGAPLEPFEYDPGPLGDEEVEITVEHCGLCHSDLSMLDNEWGFTAYPFVPGHEVVGRVTALGPHARGVALGQRVGLGWNARSCLHGGGGRAGGWRRRGGAQARIGGRRGGCAARVRARRVGGACRPGGLDAAWSGPLGCGGITVFAPPRELGSSPTARVGV